MMFATTKVHQHQGDLIFLMNVFSKFYKIWEKKVQGKWVG